jgi:C1A family cysteine protease
MILKIASLPDGTEKSVNLGAWRRDTADARDFRLKALRSAVPGAPLPVVVDNSTWCSLPTDQGDLGSCTAHVVTSILEYNDRRFNVKPTKLRVSRLFQYYATRIIEGNINEDSGASMRNAIKSAAQFGCIKESRWWYDQTKYAVNPPKKIWADAATDKIAAYHRIDDGDLDTIKKTLAHGYLVAFGMTVFPHFCSIEVSNTGIVPMPSPEEEYLGGHAVTLVGYDDTTRMFKVRNSWGRDWGQKGYFYMPYDYVGHPDLCNDFWVIVSAVTV